MDMGGDISPLLRHAVPYTLVAFRLAGLFLAAPVLSSQGVPARHKALLALTLAGATYPIVAARAWNPIETDLVGLIPLVLAESLIGLTVGLLASIPIMAMDMAGSVAGQTMGFGLAKVYNPEVDTDADVLGQLLMFLASGIFAAVGGLDQMFRGVLGTFDRVPIGAAGLEGHAPLDLVLGVLGGGLELALRVALPVVGICMLLMIVLGVIGKAMPAFNVMTVGFIIKLIAGVMVLALAVPAVAEASGDEVRRVMDEVSGWLSTLAGKGA